MSFTCSVLGLGLFIPHLTAQELILPGHETTGVGGGTPSAETEGSRATNEPKPLRPSDANSLKLFDNFASVTGLGNSQIEHIVARGTFHYGRLGEKTFELIETAAGDRMMELKWRHKGRHYREIIVAGVNEGPWKILLREVISFDNSRTWEQIFFEETRNNKVDFRRQFGHTVVSNGTRLRAKPLDADQLKLISGSYAEVPYGHFQSNFLILQPFITREWSAMGYQFKGINTLDLAKARQVYQVSHPQKQYCMFDKEKFLLLQWGSPGILGGRAIDISYYATSFERWGNVLFPSKVVIIAGQARLGTYTIDEVTLNTPFEGKRFVPPEM